MYNRTLFMIVALCFCTAGSTVAPEDEARIDQFMEDVLACTGVPGMNLAAVHGDVAIAKGYGVANIETQEPVTNKTIFNIASITKGIAGILNAIMFSKSGWADWDTPVRDIIGDWFYFNTGYLSNHTTTRDVLAHKMGFPPHDNPGYMDVFTRREWLERLRFMEVWDQYRTEFWYNNNMYSVASEVAEALGDGSEWEDLLQKEFLDPLGMSDTTFLFRAAPELEGFATSYTYNWWGELEPTPGEVFGGSKAQSAAGELASTAEDMLGYLKLLIGDGPDSIDYSVVQEAFTPEIVLDNTPLFERPWDEETAALSVDYARGLDIGHYKGVKTVGHGGSWYGYNSYLHTEPDLKVGVYTSANGFINNAQYMVTLYVRDILNGEEPWFTSQDACDKNFLDKQEKLKKDRERMSKLNPQVPRGSAGPSMPLSAYTGEFGHFLYGNISIRIDEFQNLELTYGRLGLYTMVQWSQTTFRTEGKRPASENIDIGTVEYEFNEETQGYDKLIVSGFEWYDLPTFVRGLKLEDAPPPSLDSC